MLSYPETPNIPLNNTKNTPRTLSLIYMGYWGIRGFSTVSDLFSVIYLKLSNYVVRK